MAQTTERREGIPRPIRLGAGLLLGNKAPREQPSNPVFLLKNAVAVLQCTCLPNQAPTLRLLAGTEEDLLHAFLEHVPDGIYFKDCSSRFVRVSRSLATRFGLSDPSQAINKTDFDIFSLEHAQQAFTDDRELSPAAIPS
jgi:PAS domain-containing protein